MNASEFWSLIKLIDMQTVDAEDCISGVEPLIDALSKKDPEFIQAFHEHLSQYLYALDSEERLDNSCGSGDGFLYQRAYVVASGEAAYKSTLATPDKISGDFDWCESLISVAWMAWEKSQPNEWDFEASVSFETGSNTALYN